MRRLFLLSALSTLRAEPGARPLIALSWAPADRPAVQTNLEILLIGAAWLAYTRLYFVLHPLGLTVAPSLFMHVTGRPDPFCGLTRTFAWMWRGDIATAAAVYPLGPIIFLATFPFLTVFAVGLVTRRSPVLVVTPGLGRALLIGAGIILGVNWAAKLLWLGN